MQISNPEPSPIADAVAGSARPSWLRRLDVWMAAHPWHPRLVPFAVYGAFLLLIGFARDYFPPAYPLVYTLQCGVVVALLWRYRRLLPELNLRFHWLALPVGILVFYAWVWLGMGMNVLLGEAPAPDSDLVSFTRRVNAWVLTGAPALPAPYLGSQEGSFFKTMAAPLAWVSLVLRLVGMSLVVPLFEELFIRSLILRSFLYPRRTALGLMQLALDMPLLGELLENTRWGQKAHHHEPVFGPEFLKNSLGQLTIFGVCASSVIFMLSHMFRDWPGCLVCGVAYCVLLWATRRRGLGPVVWAHGITNALIWVYTIHTGDWQFL